jgi:hypothetical protein
MKRMTVKQRIYQALYLYKSSNHGSGIAAAEKYLIRHLLLEKIPVAGQDWIV